VVCLCGCESPTEQNGRLVRGRHLKAAQCQRLGNFSNGACGQRGFFLGLIGKQGAAQLQWQGRTFLFLNPGFFLAQFDQQSIALAVALLLCVLAFVYWRVRRMIYPIRALREAADALARGEMHTRVPERERDEFGDLALDFNRMATEIQAMIAAREELLFGVSHELRTPLTRARLSLEFLPEGLRRCQLAEDLTEMGRLVEELLEFGRLRGKLQLEKSPVSIRGVVQMACSEAVQESEGVAKNKNVQLVFGVGFEGDGDPILNADSALLRRLVRNLVENAIAYGTSQNAEAAVKVTAWVERQDLNSIYFVLSVQDEGQGIPEDDAHRIFLPFARLEKSRSRESGGLGLGLAISKRIAEAHGGKLVLIRFAPMGAVFELRIPFH
jgi:signal transduction histidine kinase